MLRLIKLEIKKYKITGYIKAAIIADFVILGLLCLISYVTKSEGDIPINDFNSMFLIVDSIVRAVFIIFSAVIISKLIIEEYKNKTIMLLYMYPINRKKLIAAKLIIALIFTFAAVLISDILISGIMLVFNHFNPFIDDKITNISIAKNLLRFIINAISASCMSLISLYFGMRKKSVPATLLSSFLIICIVCSNSNNFSLNSIIAIPLTLAFIGLFIAFYTIKNLDKTDIDI